MKKYQIIYADPPWKYGFSPKAGSSIERHYTPMAIDDICSLGVKDISNDNCLLFLWVTMPLLESGLRVIKEWGFRYVTCGFVWVKNSKQFPNKERYLGIGSYTKSNAELLLIGRKGKSPINRKCKTVGQIIRTPRLRHSEKPPEVRDRIVQLMGDLPRIELFARQKVEGWDSIGFDIDGCDIGESLDKLVTL